jgi:hypothetical protein
LFLGRPHGPVRRRSYNGESPPGLRENGGDAGIIRGDERRVPGLAAKPIIDIVIAVTDSSDEPAYVPSLEAAGYVLRIRQKAGALVTSRESSIRAHSNAQRGQSFTGSTVQIEQ